ncbi:MAG: hypothetical protein R3F65_08495 [bacterium]
MTTTRAPPRRRWRTASRAMEPGLAPLTTAVRPARGGGAGGGGPGGVDGFGGVDGVGEAGDEGGEVGGSGVGASR